MIIEVTAQQLRDRGVPAISNGEWEARHSMNMRMNMSSTNMVTLVYEEVLLDLESEMLHGRNKGNRDRYQKAINEIRKEMATVRGERIYLE